MCDWQTDGLQRMSLIRLTPLRTVFSVQGTWRKTCLQRSRSAKHSALAHKFWGLVCSTCQVHFAAAPRMLPSKSLTFNIIHLCSSLFHTSATKITRSSATAEEPRNALRTSVEMWPFLTELLKTESWRFGRNTHVHCTSMKMNTAKVTFKVTICHR